MSRSPATSAFSNPSLVRAAQKRSQLHPRSLRMVGERGRTDTIVYEDRATGERRDVPRKTLLAIGPEAAYELAPQQPEFGPLLDEDGDQDG